MSRRTRMRGLAILLALPVALALPLASAAQEDEDAAAEEQAEEREPAEEEEPEDHAGSAEAEAEEEATEEEPEEEAAVDWDVTHRGFYILASGSYGFMVNTDDLEHKAEHTANFDDASSNTDNSWGYGGRIGWRFFERLALEGQFQMLNNIEVSSHVDGRSRDSKATFMTAMGNAKAYLLTQRIQPYALAGAGYGYGVMRPPGGGTNERDGGFAAQFGVGTDFYVTDNIGLMTEAAYVLPTGDIEGYDYVALYFGAMLRFYGD